MIDPSLLALLACPVCDERPALAQAGEELCCPAGHRFPIRNGIPHLLPEDELTEAARSGGAIREQ